MKRDKNVVSKIMRSVKGIETKPERELRIELWRKGFRYRKNVKDVLGKPDIANKKYKIAIFIDGDFWHGNQYKLRGYKSLEEQFFGVSNKEYWIKKINRNIERDKNVTEELISKGWKVIRVWESEIESDLPNCVERIIKTMKTNKDRKYESD